MLNSVGNLKKTKLKKQITNKHQIIPVSPLAGNSN